MGAMGFYVIEYRYPSDLKNLVEDFRPAHRTYMRALEKEGRLVASGFLSDASFEGGMVILRADSAHDANALVENDPFYLNGLMEDLKVRRWTPTLGQNAPSFDTRFPFS